MSEAPPASPAARESLVQLTPDVTPSFGPGGLALGGIGMTVGWGIRTKPLASGLTTLDGRTSKPTGGLRPRAWTGAFPLQLKWRHQQVIGEVVAMRASPLAAYFGAVVAPPGTAGYDGALLEEVWQKIRAGDATAFSVNMPQPPDDDGRWSIADLSVVLKGEGGNPLAQILKAAFPDGSVVRHPMPHVTEANSIRDYFDLMAFRRNQRAAAAAPAPEPANVIRVVRDCDGRMIGFEKTTADGRKESHAIDGAGPNLRRVVEEEVQRALHESSKGKRAAMLAAQQAPQSPDIRELVREEVAQRVATLHRGTWKPDESYTRGEMTTHDGGTWVCRRDCAGADSKPGRSESWQLIVKGRDSNR